MVNNNFSCRSPQTNNAKIYNYEEYYFGDKDSERRRNGKGENYWSGPYSLEWYAGSFTQDALHGRGEYRWRHRGGFPPCHRDVTYEGYVYANQLLGYGTMSYPHGIVFDGLYHSGMRWGPGVESHVNVRQNVGLWRGRQLVKLAWRPAAPSIIPDLLSLQDGRDYVESYRALLMHDVKEVGKTNSAIDLLKQQGTDPVAANRNWRKLYTNNCTDLASKFCYKDVFTRDYYDKNVHELKVLRYFPNTKADSEISGESSISRDIYYAWNNNRLIIHMMSHCFTHEKQREHIKVELPGILHGPRKRFLPPGDHESHCRTLLMSSYLGNVNYVTRFVNEHHVYPDVADIQGNTALMYATCGDKTDIIHFLVEAGADVNSYNDSCLTPLGVALVRFLCLVKDIQASQIVQSVIPPHGTTQHHVPQNYNMNVSDWIVSRELSNEVTAVSNATTPPKSKIPPYPKPAMSKKVKSVSEYEASKMEISKFRESAEGITSDLIIDDLKSLNSIEQQYLILVNDIFSLPTTQPVQYLFVAQDITREVLESFEDSKKVVDKNAKKPVPKVLSKLKNEFKQSKEMIGQKLEEKMASKTSFQKYKLEMINQVRSTISQLLSDGAKPGMVRCPQPALVLATFSGCSELVKQLIDHGADIHEKYPQFYNYTALDIAVSEPLSFDNLELIRTFLECGANTNDRIDYYEILNEIPVITPGPTLLHAILAKNYTTENEEEIFIALLGMLLRYKCNPTLLFKGRSAIDVAMTKKLELLDIFIKSPTTNLNAVINDLHQTCLVKMFSTKYFKTLENVQRLQTFTNLLLFGADPLLECQDEDRIFANMFVYANSCFNKDIQKDKPVDAAAKNTNTKDQKKNQTTENSQKNSKGVAKSGKADAEMLLGDYKQAVDLVADCARVIITRWLEARLLNEIVVIIDKFKHRQWNMILKEHKNKKPAALWLHPQRCLEIWEIMKKAKKRLYHDERVLKYLLSFVLFYNKRLEVNDFKNPPVAKEKNEVDKEVWLIIFENKSTLNSEDFAQKHYVKPELDVRVVEKYNVCYECIMPLTDTSICCESCKLVSFCSMDCIELNVNRIGCHPCSFFLKEIYFPEQTQDNSNIRFRI